MSRKRRQKQQADLAIKQAYYLIVDLEATCDRHNKLAREAREIIEIGAVMLNRSSLVVESEFQTFVRPQRHPILTDFCTELTSIQQTDVDNAPDFRTAMAAFQAWFEPYRDFRFCSWGAFDRHQFQQDCQYHNIPYPELMAQGHLNVKWAFRDELGDKQPCGMKEAVARLGLQLDGTHHRGLDDARNIARIVQALWRRRRQINGAAA